MSTLDLERRIRVLEDIEEIKRLKARYNSYCDDSYDVDGIAGLFTEDGIWDGGSFALTRRHRGVAVGRAQIRKFFENNSDTLPFAVHMVMNPIIEVDGDTATGIWYLFQAGTVAAGNQAIWGAARYDDEYRRVDWEWKIKHLRLTSFFWTPFDEGWAKNQFIAPP